MNRKTIALLISIAMAAGICTACSAGGNEKSDTAAGTASEVSQSSVVSDDTDASSDESSAASTGNEVEVLEGRTLTILSDVFFESYYKRIYEIDDYIDLDEVIIGKDVTAVSSDIPGAKKISVSDGNETFTAVDGVLFSKDKTKLVRYPEYCYDKTYVVPDGVTEISRMSFNKAKVENITLPDGVKTIGEYAFSTSNLVSIDLPDGITEIGDGAFMTCLCLESLSIPDSVTSIGDKAFKHCTAMKTLTVPKGVAYMGSKVFEEWKEDQTITVQGRASAPDTWDTDWMVGCPAKIEWNA